MSSFLSSGSLLQGIADEKDKEANPDGQTDVIKAFLYDDGLLDLGTQSLQPDPKRTVIREFDDYVGERAGEEETPDWC